MWLAIVLQSMSLDNEEATSHSVQQFLQLVLWHTILSWDHTTQQGSYIFFFLNLLNEILFPQGDQEQMVWNFVVVWDNVQFHHSALVREWFENHPQFRMVFLPPYSPFLNPVEEFFSSWRWKVHDRNPYNQVSLQAMEEACGDIGAQACQGWIQHSRRFFPTMHDSWKYFLWCWWSSLARCNWEAWSIK